MVIFAFWDKRNGWGKLCAWSQGLSLKATRLSQKPYIYIILERFQMKNYKPINTHIAKFESLSHNMESKTSEERDQMELVPYSIIFGSLMYAMMYTHPNICYVVGLISRY